MIIANFKSAVNTFFKFSSDFVIKRACLLTHSRYAIIKPTFRRGAFAASDCRQKAILPPKGGGRIALSANERIAEFLDFAI